MPPNRGRRLSAKQVAVETLEAKQRAYADSSVILKEPATNDILISCGYDPSRSLAALLVLVSLKLGLNHEFVVLELSGDS